MDQIALIVNRLNMPPFNKGFGSMSELDGMSSLEMLDILCEVVGAITDEKNILQDATEQRIERIMVFLTSICKFQMPDEEQFRNAMMQGDKETLTIVLHDCLRGFERYKKRAYLAKFLMPLDIPPEFRNEELVLDLEARLKDMQGEFKEVHREVERVRQENGGQSRPSDLKAEIQQLEGERSQLQAKIQRLKKEKESLGDDSYFQDMLRATSNLRKEQEEEVRLIERMRESRMSLQQAEVRYNDASKRLGEIRQTGGASMSAEQILNKLERDVAELQHRRDAIESTLSERESHLEKVMGWENSDRVLTADDVREKRIQVDELERDVSSMNDRLDGALERNNKLVVFRQASTMAQKKLREKEDDIEQLSDERRRLMRQLDEKEAAARARGDSPSKAKVDMQRYGAVFREKIDKFRKMREELGSLRAELVVLQRTEQILRSRNKNLDVVLSDLERRKGVEGYRDTQKALVEMSEKTAEVDQMKGATLEQISSMVEKISREFRSKQAQLQPLMTNLKKVRQEYMEVEADFSERKSNFDKVAVGLEIEKSALERECDTYQVSMMLIILVIMLFILFTLKWGGI